MIDRRLTASALLAALALGAPAFAQTASTGTADGMSESNAAATEAAAAAPATDVQTSDSMAPGAFTATAGSTGLARGATPDSGTLMTSPINADDFIETASSSGVAEIQSAQLALEKATSPQIKDYAQQMIDEHGSANAKLKALADKKGLEVESEPGMISQARAQILKMHDGASFDEAYLDNQVEAHQKTISLFERAAQSDDADIRSYAEETLPALKQHLSEVRDMQAKLEQNS